MANPVKFQINWEKAIEAIVWLASEKPKIDFFHVGKVLFYADKAHILEHGRPILGDTYIAMEYGPVPSGVRDLLNNNDWLPPELLEAIGGAFEVHRVGLPRVTAKREPNLDLFSASDLGCLRESLDQYGGMPFDRLKSLTHRERAWLAAPANGPIDYILMVDDDVEDREELLEEIHENAAYAVM